MSFLSKRKIIAALIGGCILLLILFLPFASSAVHNEIRLKFLEKRTEEYSHPPDSQVLQRVALTGNFAPASNQCGFIVAETRATRLKPDDIHLFYASILANASYDKGPPYHEVRIYNLTDKNDVENIELLYPDVYERITDITMTDDHSYLLLTAETGYPPNYDPRCH